MKKNVQSADAIAGHFVSYLYQEYGGNKHVRRVASWLGFIVLGLARITGLTLEIRRTRQLGFVYKNRKFKVKFNHGLGAAKQFKRGGIEVVEILPERGEPRGGSVVEINNLMEAEDFYLTCKDRLDKFCRSN